MDVDRLKTGVLGFDEIVSGGIPRNSVVLLSGSPGTGKTLFAFQSLINACKRGEKGMFVSFEQSAEDLISQAKLLGWDIDKLVSNGTLVIRSVDALTDLDFLDKLPREVADQKLKFLIIDSITALQNSPAMMKGTEIIRVIATSNPNTNASNNQLSMHESTVRRLSVHYLMNTLKQMHVTSFVISDIKDESNQLSSDGISEFLADGLIIFYYTGMSGEEARTLQVRKMRWTKQKKGFFPFEIGEKGLQVQLEGSSVLMK